MYRRYPERQPDPHFRGHTTGALLTALVAYRAALTPGAAAIIRDELRRRAGRKAREASHGAN
jgi:hypothetical protein